MKRHRFKVETLEGGVVRLVGREAHHATDVLRIKARSEIAVFDGTGGEAIAMVESVAAGEVVARIIQHTQMDAQTTGLQVATAIPKGERADWMIEKCAELGVEGIVPLICERGQVTPGSGKLDRWRRKVEAAAKQSGHTSLMQIAQPATIAEVLEEYKIEHRYYCEPSAAGRCADAITHAARSRMIFFVGPEGGFTKDETALLDRSAVRGVRLGGSILRIETAVIAVAVLAAAALDSRG